MGGPYYYPFSTVYLATHISRLSRGLVVIGLAAICWVLVIGIAALIVNLF